MGQVVGGILAVYILQLIWEKLVFMRLANDPMKGKLFSTVAGYLTAVVLFGFGSADGGAWRPDGALIYLPGLLIIGVFAWRRAKVLREEASKQTRIDAFD
ncbi:hypothetical protein [Novosphingobium sp. TH158]|uniref:hypothetical protein n=1 Tax=Novosphingobium sp. TH158 TaxID=2067455 RepID=UPI000C7CCFE7|nr:hypothetical protein [Novosphingobium sp. TH158]PLK25563.1 hypothetical protein C0V78_00625 [Novosphingobium sp. TH158]